MHDVHDVHDGQHGRDGDLSAYPAPPPYRPVSALAVTALVLAVFGGFLAFTGFWWLAIPGLVLGAFAWSALADGRKRGRRLGLAAAILSLLAGVGAFAGNRAAERGLEQAIEPLVQALARGDAEEVARWVAPPQANGVAAPGGGGDSVARWTSRMAAARAEAGAYSGRLEVGSVWGGALIAAFATPRHIEELAPLGEDKLEPGNAVWVRAHFERGALWLALVAPRDPVRDPKGSRGVLDLYRSLGENPGSRIRLADVRVFRSRR